MHPKIFVPSLICTISDENFVDMVDENPEFEFVWNLETEKKLFPDYTPTTIGNIAYAVMRAKNPRTRNMGKSILFEYELFISPDESYNGLKNRAVE